MGTGKSTVGPLAAAKLDVPFVDTDEIVAREAGASIPELWRRDGEAAFRERERAVLEMLLADGTTRVIALGGGTLLARDLRHFALDRAVVVTLTSEPDEILRRVSDVSNRPNLAAADPKKRIADLLEARADAYAECHASLATDGVDADEIAEAAVAVARLAPSSLVVVSDAQVRRVRGAQLERALSHLALPHVDVTLPHGEEHKTLGTVSTIWDAGLGAGIDRDALVVAFGGGVTSDLACFAASTLLRGVRCVTVPTTLLAMADASVGGKTGFDHAVGKNLIGTIHQPRAVVVDTAHLETLAARELRAGLAEIVKIAVATSAPLFERLEAEPRALLDPSSRVFLEVVRESIALKARIVRDDERESGRRAILNLGHTIGHALEAHGRYRKWLHGEAVALGLVRELQITQKRGWSPPEITSRTTKVLASFGLPTEVSADDMHAATRFLGADKKRGGDPHHPTIALPIVTVLGHANVRKVPSEVLREG
jgi:shikimate kinase/3-dehydroquinate synthase